MGEEFTVRINPHLGESIFSFIRRLAKENCVQFLTFCRMIENESNHFFQMSEVGGLNKNPQSRINLHKLSEMSGVEVDLLKSMTLINLTQVLGGGSGIDRARFLIGLTVDEYRYCPNCLKEHNYHKLIWILAIIDYCDIHGEKLMNTCPSCGKSIKLKDIIDFNECPFCKSSLSDNSSIGNDCAEMKLSIWIAQSINELNNIRVVIEPSEVAMKSLFILNNYDDIYNKKRIIEALNGERHLSSLLQIARKSLVNKRSVQLTFLLEMLYFKKTTITDFFNMVVPQSFVESVVAQIDTILERSSCQAPWCNHFHKNGMLIKTGTTKKINTDGKVLLYFMFCQSCGCEYAIDENHELIERTYFTDAYYRLLEDANKEFSFSELCCRFRFTADKMNRCLAYFQSRGLFVNVARRMQYDINVKIQEEFVSALYRGILMKQIQKWRLWDSYFHFLVYRFTLQVMIKEVELRNSNRNGLSRAGSTNVQRVKATVEALHQRNQKITINNVCKEIGICPETIRNWKCNELIAELKDQENKNAQNLSRIQLIEQFEAIKQEYEHERIITSDVYAKLGVSRNILWRSEPKLTAYFHEVIKNHNKDLKKGCEANGGGIK